MGSEYPNIRFTCIRRSNIFDERTFQALVKEALATGKAPSRRVHDAVRASYGAYYRRMMPKLLAVLDFRSNNSAHKPLTNALGEDPRGRATAS